MASLDVDGPHLETGESENGGGQADHREGQGCGELGAACYRWIGQLGRLGTTSATLCCFGNFMKKKGRSRTAGGGIAGEYCSPDSWRRGSWARRTQAGGDGWGRE